PAKGLVVVKSDRIYKEGISCELLDLLGRKLVQTSIPPGGIFCFFETPALPNGQYLVRITDGSQVITKKVQLTE
ncbi:MAG TPA: T9SS type A sorting domain-containing protein, partial [Catalimonadaceae bacterium]|nr:T9SS type A sorting domain-containing protein [Catalimonadaceae bacterium]